MVLVLSLSINFGLRPEGLEILFPSRKLWTGGTWHSPRGQARASEEGIVSTDPVQTGVSLPTGRLCVAGKNCSWCSLCWVCAGWSFPKDGKAPAPQCKLNLLIQPLILATLRAEGERSQVQGLFGLRVSEFKTSLASFLRSYLKVKSKRKLASWAYSSVVDICRACLWTWVQSLVLYNINNTPKNPNWALVLGQSLHWLLMPVSLTRL